MSTRIEKSDLARDALYEKVNAIANELDSDKVSKSGDTMSGTLTNNGIMVSNLDNINFIARSKSLVKGTTPTDSNKYIGYDWQDKNGQRLAYLGVSYNKNGTKRLELQKLDSNLSEFNISYVIRNPYSFYFQDTQHTLGNVDVNTWSNNQIQFQDSKGTKLARVQPLLATDGTARLCLAASKGLESESSLIIGSDGYTRCPKPADNSNTNAIATTNWAGGLNRPNIWLSSNTFKGGGIEFSPANNPNHGGFIDFHYNGSTSDYTSRIIEGVQGRIEFVANTLTSGTAYFNERPYINTNTDDNRLICKCINLIKGTAPTKTQFGGVSTYDKNNAEVATLYSSIDTNNNVTSALWVKQPTASGTTAKSISIYCDKNGNFYTYAPESSRNNSIDTIVEHGQFYIKYGSGLLIQWGVIYDLNANVRTITLQTPFSNPWYYANVITSYGGATVNDPPTFIDTRFNIYRKEKTYFKVQGNNVKVNVDWLAIGYWKEFVL